jgi:fumarate reductase iron-sulfur subunit
VVSRALRVFRWSSQEGERRQDYQVEEGPDTTVLDALVAIQREQDPTLAFRYACRVGMCGSCGMVIDGRERWACRTRLRALGRRAVIVRPLYHLPVLRDLVVDMAPFVDRARSVRGAFVSRATPAVAPPSREEIPAPGSADYALISPGSRARREVDEAIECIGCGMCLSACTIAGRNPRFPGPAALNRAFTLQRDARDAGTAARWSVLLSDDGLARCHGQGNCTEVCPMGLTPARSIVRLRQLATQRLFSELRPGSR